jgi:hypothetical protein
MVAHDPRDLPDRDGMDSDRLLLLLLKGGLASSILGHETERV